MKSIVTVASQMKQRVITMSESNIGDDIDFANQECCQHYNTEWIDEIINAETGEVLQNDFEKCVDCGEIFYDE